MTLDHSNGRIEGESFFIYLSNTNNNILGTEMILGISKIGDSSQGMYMEFYNLNDKTFKKYQTYNALGNIITDSFAIMKTPDESQSYYYTLTYISSNNYRLNLKKVYFTYTSRQVSYNQVQQDNSLQVANHRMVSCFYTVNLIYICFYLNQSCQLNARAYKSDLSEPIDTLVYSPFSFSSTEKVFFKSIHFKGEIGFYIYFQSTNTLKFSILQCNDARSMIPYSGFSQINIDKTYFNFNSDDRLNDILKLNDFQIIYLSVSQDYKIFLFVTFTLYKNDTLINIRYYKEEMWPHYGIKIFHDLKGGLYKSQFISLAFSNCPQEACSTSGTDLYYASLIIFCYPNSTDNSLDIIPHLYENNKNIENDFSFNFEGTLTIENNLFGFVFKGTRIMKLPIGLNLTNVTNGNFLEIESIIKRRKCIFIF